MLLSCVRNGLYAPHLSALALTTRKSLRYISRTAFPKITKLEVERKFNVTALLKSLFEEAKKERSAIYRPPDPSAGNLKLSDYATESFIDQYFDREGQLAAKGIWIRKRIKCTSQLNRGKELFNEDFSGEWEAKVRVGGDRVNSSMIEYKSKEKILELWIQYLGSDKILAEEMNAEIFTVRQMCRVQETPPVAGHEKLVMVDQCNTSPLTDEKMDSNIQFSHLIGELESLKSIHSDEDQKVVEQNMRAELDNLIEQYPLLFPTQPRPEGKLSSYFAWKHQTKELFKRRCDHSKPGV